MNLKNKTTPNNLSLNTDKAHNSHELLKNSILVLLQFILMYTYPVNKSRSYDELACDWCLVDISCVFFLFLRFILKYIPSSPQSDTLSYI